MSVPNSKVPDRESDGIAVQDKTEVLAPATNPNLDNSASTSAHRGGPDPTTTQPPASFTAKHDPTNTCAKDPTTSKTSKDAAQGGLAPASASSTTELSDLKVKLQSNLRQFPNFPQPGILFEDIMPIFASYDLHCTLISALEMLICDAFQTKVGQQSEVDCIVGLESRGFLFGPTLALR